MSKSKDNQTNGLIIVLILAVAAAVRLWGIDFEMPYLDSRTDEITIFGIAKQFFTGDYNPHFFNYPTLYIYLVHGLYGTYLLAALCTLKFDSLQDLYFKWELQIHCNEQVTDGFYESIDDLYHLQDFSEILWQKNCFVIFSIFEF